MSLPTFAHAHSLASECAHNLTDTHSLEHIVHCPLFLSLLSPPFWETRERSSNQISIVFIPPSALLLGEGQDDVTKLELAEVLLCKR